VLQAGGVRDFLEKILIEEWCDEHRVPLLLSTAVGTVVSTRFFGDAISPRGQEASVAAAVLAELGEWDECLLWIQQWSIWPSSEDWPAYYGERGVRSERRSLRVAPGHLAQSEDRDALATFLPDDAGECMGRAGDPSVWRWLGGPLGSDVSRRARRGSRCAAAVREPRPTQRCADGNRLRVSCGFAILSRAAWRG
jgi:hypothetical protein